MLRRSMTLAGLALLAAAALAAANQCKGKTQEGARCKNMTSNANGYCHLHQSQAK